MKLPLISKLRLDKEEWLNRINPFIGLLIVFALFSIIAPESFSSSKNLETIVRYTTIVGIVALGMTLVIISGGIDLSVGSIIALSTVVSAWFLQAGFSPLVAAIIGSIFHLSYCLLIIHLKSILLSN